MIRSDSTDAISAALSAAQGEFEAVAKSAANPFFKSAYAPLPEVVKAATPILTKHGLAVWQGGDTDDEGELLWTVVLHSSGQFIGSAARLLPIKNDPQAQGSATTYQRRYQYMAALSLVADEDDDGNAASKAGTRRPAGRRETRSKATTRTRPAQAPSEPQDASQGTSEAPTVTPETLEALMDAYRASGVSKDDLKAMMAEAGAEGKKPNELTEDQATWTIIKLRDRKAAA